MDTIIPPSLNSTLRPDYIPTSDYTSPEFHRLELERLWPKVWQVACRVEEIPCVGDYVNYEIGDDSILVIRSSSDAIKAFYNVCSHRGRRLCDNAKGHVSVLRCNFHAWCYNLQGKATFITDAEDWKGCPDFDETNTSLVEVKCDTWAGFVWINMDPDCEPLLQFLDPLPTNLDAFEFENCRLQAYWTLRVPANWKVVLGAFVEGYHSTGTHPQMLRFGKPYYPAASEDLKGTRKHSTHSMAIHPSVAPDAPRKHDPRELLHDVVIEINRTLGAMYLDPSVAAAARLMTEVAEGTSEEEVHNLFFQFQREETLKIGASWPEKLTLRHLWSLDWQIFPNSSVIPSADGALWYRMRPDGTKADSCIFDIWILGRFAPHKEPKVEQVFFNNVGEFSGRSLILEQDFANLIAVQKGIRCRGFRGARPNPIQEVGVTNIHRVLRQYLFGGQ
jgi:phenylpropionate dioxygenase-like ring-hydroxylating dioxygenase large terminal subunit